MKKTTTKAILFYVIILAACVGQNNVTHIVPDEEYFNNKPDKLIKIDSITETRDGTGFANVPDWMFAYITGGIAEVEIIDFYRNRYLFIGENEGENFTALNKWADNYSVVKDFPRLAAVRIEKRLISAASLYPDDEYGSFFETLVKKAFDAEYPDAVKEETYWIKIKNNQEYDIEQEEEESPPEIYNFFVFVSINKATMQTVIGNMMSEVIAEVTPTRVQSASINRLQNNFFEGF